MIIAPLYSKDKEEYLRILGQLSPVSELDDTAFEILIYSKEYFLWGCFNDNGTLIGIGTLYLEYKAARGGGPIVGHIEDVVVDKEYRGLGVGAKIVNHLISIAKRYKCYKVVLNCSEKNKQFYEKLGFKEHDVGMRMDL